MVLEFRLILYGLKFLRFRRHSGPRGDVHSLTTETRKSGGVGTWGVVYFN